MPSVSKKQQKFMGIVRAIQKGDQPAGKFSKDARDAAKKMKKKDVKKFAKTKHDGLPTKVRQEIEEYVDGIIDGIGEQFMVNEEQCMCEACQKGYMTHPTRKTKEMFGKRYRNCIKKESTKAYSDTLNKIANDKKMKMISKKDKDTLVKLAKLMKSANESYDFKKAHKKFKETGELPPHLKKMAQELDKMEKKYKIKNIVVPGLEWMSKIGESIDEGKYSKIMKAVRKGPKSGPWQIIVSKNNKVVKEVPVKTLQLIPAHYDDIKKAYPNHKIGIEAKDGKIVYREWVVNIKEGSCGYGIDGNLGEEPAGPHLLKKKKKKKDEVSLGGRMAKKIGKHGGTRDKGEIAKILKLLIKRGNKKKDAMDMINKNYDRVSKAYRKASPAKKAEILSSLQESVNEAKYKGYDYKRQNRKDGLPLIVPALRKTFANMKDLKKYIDKHGKMESVTEMNSPMFKITYKDSRGAKKTDIMRSKNSNLAKRDFNALHRGRGFKILKVVKESVNEVSGVDVAKKVLKNKQHEKGIDLQTANLIVTIDKAYDKKPALQKKFRAIQLPKMKQLITKYYG